ncbi:hypothetical protein SKAU_G00272470 [Synaphobranchus kaupii]|uniref:Uncharacterized protein n=1 Tax=Synaphobranchus kaupii TaxID=118154 RepID=A0A9Q1INP8_SYNKA|nr:hypothetical protein SKAU_G00272470 [Synaphobranchus kaupii]
MAAVRGRGRTPERQTRRLLCTKNPAESRPSKERPPRSAARTDGTKAISRRAKLPITASETLLSVAVKSAVPGRALPPRREGFVLPGTGSGFVFSLITQGNLTRHSSPLVNTAPLCLRFERACDSSWCRTGRLDAVHLL